MPNEKASDLNDPDYEDPILRELWQIREEIAAEFNYDIGAMVRSIQEEESRTPPELFGSPRIRRVKRHRVDVELRDP